MKYSYHHIVSIQTSKRWREEQDRNNNINNKRNIDMQKKNETVCKSSQEKFVKKFKNGNQNRIGLLRVCSTT